ncbi:MAG: hypothetical protein ACK42I_05670, partial [Thermomicrobium sp.]
TKLYFNTITHTMDDTKRTRAATSALLRCTSDSHNPVAGNTSPPRLAPRKLVVDRALPTAQLLVLQELSGRERANAPAARAPAYNAVAHDDR